MKTTDVMFLALAAAIAFVLYRRTRLNVAGEPFQPPAPPPPDDGGGGGGRGFALAPRGSSTPPPNTGGGILTGPPPNSTTGGVASLRMMSVALAPIVASQDEPGSDAFEDVGAPPPIEDEDGDIDIDGAFKGLGPGGPGPAF